jgi:hypothetical protein
MALGAGTSTFPAKCSIEVKPKGSSLAISGGQNPSIDGCTVDNGGTMTVSSGFWQGKGAVINNLEGGLFDV